MMRAFRSGLIRTSMLVIVLLSAGVVEEGYAQLISPGKLSRSHADLEGLTRCTNCHRLGTRGIANDKCLSCHEPLQTRIARNEGYHATVADQNCANCHKEHFGRAFEPTRFDTTAFDHGLTGFDLAGKHTEAACRSCHKPAFITAADVRRVKEKQGVLSKTFLGLEPRCLTCHRSDDPHAGQFETQTCENCHSENTWEEAERFDHDATRFPLEGLHRDVSCESCHPTEKRPGDEPFVRYEGIAFARCASCHEDPHQGSMGPQCSNCHGPSGWQNINRSSFERRFDHDATDFPLLGSHARAQCMDCHRKPPVRTGEIRITFVRGTEDKAYPHPEAANCASCHVDYHQGVFEDNPGGIVCENCHTREGWTPTTFDLDRHNRETTFELTGAHLAAPCASCHVASDRGSERLQFHFEDLACLTCHTDDNPHGDQFADASGATACEACHTTEAWLPVEAFDHDRTGFPLTGAHRDATCESCHRAPPGSGETPEHLYRGLDAACASCHRKDDPHQGQFDAVSCETCHDTVSFRLTAFDHDATRFPLDGAHTDVPCAGCHKTEQTDEGVAFVRFKPLGTACIDCHSDLK
ncbi:cytochrome c3 family protein [Rhodocaloribacter sp.]